MITLLHDKTSKFCITEYNTQFNAKIMQSIDIHIDIILIT